MKKLLLTTAVFFAFACNTGNLDNEGSETNNESNAEQHSKENISPQGEDRIAVDTVSGANGIGGEKQDELR